MKFKDLDKSVRYAFYAMGVTFVCLLIATGITVYIANKDHEPVVDPQYYEKGLNYEKTLEDIRIMQEEGYHVATSLLEETYPLVQGDNKVEILFTKSGIPLEDAKVTILRERGATFKFNKGYILTHAGKGVYTTNVDIPDLGQWVVTIQATHLERTLKKTVKIVVQR